jgi:hypothetical protein
MRLGNTSTPRPPGRLRVGFMGRGTTRIRRASVSRSCERAVCADFANPSNLSSGETAFTRSSCLQPINPVHSGQRYGPTALYRKVTACKCLTIDLDQSGNGLEFSVIARSNCLDIDIDIDIGRRYAATRVSGGAARVEYVSTFRPGNGECGAYFLSRNSRSITMTTPASPGFTGALNPSRSPGCGVGLPLFEMRAPTTTRA